MNRTSFLSQLSDGLSGLPQQEIDDIIADYAMHFSEGAAAGRAIAQACGISVRSVHRAFEAEPGGSVSNYVWIRRLSRCAAELRNPGQAHRPITEVCFTWGFNSTSHFSRLFKERFGVTPREYRQASERFGETNAREPRAASLIDSASP